jgi:hypothetical protein
MFTPPKIFYASGLSELVTVCPAALPAGFTCRHSAIPLLFNLFRIYKKS